MGKKICYNYPFTNRTMKQHRSSESNSGDCGIKVVQPQIPGKLHGEVF